MTPVFIALVEVRPLPGAPLDHERIGGAAVRCYIPAQDEPEARARLLAKLEADRFELSEVEFCHPYGSDVWSGDDDGTDESGVTEAAHSGRLVYGTFHTWPAGEEDVT